MFGIFCLLLVSSASFARASAVVPAGSKIWSFKAGHGNRTCVGTPAVSSDGKMVYVGSFEKSSAHLDAVDALTGRKIWSSEIGGAESSSPVVNSNGKLVYVGSATSVLAFDTLHGRKIWSFPTDSHYDSQDLDIAVDSDGKAVYMRNPQCYYCNFTAINALDGSEIWSIQPINSIPYSHMAISRDGKVVYVMSGFPNLALLAFDTLNGNKIWSFTTNIVYARVAPAVSNDGKMVFVFCSYQDDDFCAVDTLSGTLMWSINTNSSLFNYPATPAVSNDDKVVYVTATDGDNWPDPPYVYALTTLNGSKLWRYLGTSPYNLGWSTPVVSSDGKVVYIWNTNSELHAIDALDGSKIWSFHTSSFEPNAIPAISHDNKVVYIGSCDSLLYAVSAAPAPAPTRGVHA